MFDFGSSQDSSKQQLLDDGNFEHETPFSFDKLILHLEEANQDLENLKPYDFLSALWELTKFMKALSSALSMGFSDITTKVQIWRRLFKEVYPDSKDMISVMETEIKMGIHELNGENNSKKGFKKGSPYYKYESGIIYVINRNKNNAQISLVLRIYESDCRVYVC